uniref:COX assembly mitochondrial protein n=1 Tax=Trypanosoma congolense (strain IL3000) TaxID=1068625 RepID=G0UQG4_TRYCI|nr:conserved hypothetical protein [Trypanosoma congolense IL3000]
MGTTTSKGTAGTEASAPGTDVRPSQWHREDPVRFQKYAHLRSQADSRRNQYHSAEKRGDGGLRKNLIEEIYEEDFDTVDRVQSLRMPPMVMKELRDAVATEAERRCSDAEKKMARCLQDKMWTSWKCQKERDAFYQCVAEKKNDNDLLMAYRWKYNLGTFHGEIIGRNNMMKRIWKEHFPDRDLPHPWVKDM